MLNELCTRLASQDAVLVSIASTQGSVPRGVGAWMAVFADGVLNTIGGGHVEFQAIDAARKRLAGLPGDNTLRYTLGPSLGQCCGGAVHLQFERVTAADIPALEARLATPLTPVALFG
ncbi:MAG: XdhC family protein, partial [Gammaproteobacteria bacterium]|nr:XdhC family protein [Gammaproteobacteria bacterium]